MAKSFEEKMKDILLKQRKDIIDKIKKSDILEDSSNDSSEEDAMVTSIEQIKGEGLKQHDHNMLKAIEAALSRISTGSYGKCARCGGKISKERLEAIPYALLCIDCKTDIENKNSRLEALRNSQRNVEESEDESNGDDD